MTSEERYRLDLAYRSALDGLTDTSDESSRVRFRNIARRLSEVLNGLPED